MQNLVEVEDDADASLSGSGLAAVVPPGDPLVALAAAIARVQSEVGRSELEVGELTESARQPAVRHRAVVRQVVKVHVGAATVARPARVRPHAVCSMRLLLKEGEMSRTAARGKKIPPETTTLDDISKFCMKFGHLILRKIIKFVATDVRF